MPNNSMTPPKEFQNLSFQECSHLIEEKKALFVEELVILTHHYQRSEIVHYGDFVGDSYALSAKAAAQKKAKYIVFAGVHFMAESADILSDDSKAVFLANAYAGCPMADMANEKQVMKAWGELAKWVDTSKTIPVSYMNSTAGLKAFCGENKGLVCTSSNADKAFRYAFDKGERVFFFPDEHLGRNTANKLAIEREAVLVWDPAKPYGGNDKAAIEKGRVFLWKGYCNVHQKFTVDDIEKRRTESPNAFIIVHPECREEVVDIADASGSTVAIVKAVENASKGDKIFIGTELSLVNRLAMEYPDVHIEQLSTKEQPVCVNMFRTSINDLAYVLAMLGKEEVNRIRVEEPVKSNAKLALERMLEIA